MVDVEIRAIVHLPWRFFSIVHYHQWYSCS